MVRRVCSAVLLSVALVVPTTLAASTVLATPAQAQAADQPPKLQDFCNNGVCDYSGYAKALADFLSRSGGGGSGSLPVTGGDYGLLIGVGVSLVLVGGTVIWGANKRRSMTEAPADDIA